jgi:hypothetical protein
VHGDLEPRNVARVRGGGFRLIDFSESRKHVCKENRENKVQYVITSLLIAVNIGIVGRQASHPVQTPKCPELQALRQLLWRRQPPQKLQIPGGN